MNRPLFHQRDRAGFTLIELMVTVALMALVISLAAPSFKNMIVMQRLRGTNAQLVTDMQLGRAEAAYRGTLLRVVFDSDATKTCYTLFTSPSNASRCDCLLGPGAACGAGLTEVRTVQILKTQEVIVSPPANQSFAFAYDPTTGGIYSIPTDNVSRPINSFSIETYADNARKLTTIINRAGRPIVCTPAGSTMSESSCPP